jgi:hypothetical protein
LSTIVLNELYAGKIKVVGAGVVVILDTVMSTTASEHFADLGT